MMATDMMGWGTMSFQRLTSLFAVLVVGQVCVLAMFSVWTRGGGEGPLHHDSLQKLRDFYNLTRDCKHTDPEVCMNVVSGLKSI